MPEFDVAIEYTKNGVYRTGFRMKPGGDRAVFRALWNQYCAMTKECIEDEGLRCRVRVWHWFSWSKAVFRFTGPAERVEFILAKLREQHDQMTQAFVAQGKDVRTKSGPDGSFRQEWS